MDFRSEVFKLCNVLLRDCVKRMGVCLKRGKLLRELFAVYKINFVGDLL